MMRRQPIKTVQGTIRAPLALNCLLLLATGVLQWRLDVRGWGYGMERFWDWNRARRYG